MTVEYFIIRQLVADVDGGGIVTCVPVVEYFITFYEMFVGIAFKRKGRSSNQKKIGHLLLIICFC